MIRYDQHHPGTLHVVLKEDVEVEVPGVPAHQADAILDDLYNRRNARVDGPLTGTKYVIEGYAMLVATWEPDK